MCISFLSLSLTSCYHVAIQQISVVLFQEVNTLACDKALFSCWNSPYANNSSKLMLLVILELWSQNSYHLLRSFCHVRTR